MEDMNVTKALLKAILELIEKCETLEERQENHGRVKKEDQPPSKATDLQHRTNGEPGALPRPPSILTE